MKGLLLIQFTFGLFLGMFRRITAAASRLFTADGNGGSFYGLESLNAHVRSMIPTHPALVLLWCQILLLVSHTDYHWWAEVQQTPRYVCAPGQPVCQGSAARGLAILAGRCKGCCCLLTFQGCCVVWRTGSDQRHSK